MKQGRIVMMDRKHGFGFIRTKGQKDVFFLLSDTSIPERMLHVGCKVNYTIKDNFRLGRLEKKAVHLQLVMG